MKFGGQINSHQSRRSLEATKEADKSYQNPGHFLVPRLN